ncbi:MAG: family transcriptional regulator [Frankiales bacterium]|jgi:transcriptional regulator with XRE-family HTH domain|nr:family transcriptional regulator [Frankiales bacterium]
MVRLALTEQERERGVALGAALRRARGARPVREVAAAAGVAEETVRKIERGAVPTPALFTVAAIAQVLGLALDELVHETRCARPMPDVA